MTKASDQLRELMLDLAWSLWTGLGVPGNIDEHGDHAIDPEALVVFTAALGDADPRLRDEATDWCIRHGDLLSGARLKNLLAREDESINGRFGELAATVAAHSSLRWPGRTVARDHTPRARPRTTSFNRPSQLVLRLRALLGVGARAEIVRAFLASPAESYSAADLAGLTSYTKRNVAQVLEALRLAGTVEGTPFRNQIRFTMPQARVGQFREQLAPIPTLFVGWPSAFRVLAGSLETICNFESQSDTVRAVEARAATHDLDVAIRAARLPRPKHDQKSDAYWSDFVKWVIAIAQGLASGEKPKG